MTEKDARWPQTPGILSVVAQHNRLLAAEEAQPGGRVNDGDVEIDYTNWRGERRSRKIRPLRFFHGATEWHKTPCWQCYALDLETKALRNFALPSVHSWRELDA